MASTSERTFGARLANAIRIQTQLTNSGTYQPPAPEISLDTLARLIESIQHANAAIANLQAAYSTAVDQRQRAFRKDADSVYKLLSPIAAGVRASYGKDAKETADIQAMISKTRGIRLRKVSGAADDKTISQSQVSYGSMAMAFSDLVTTIGNYTRYNPGNSRIALDTLQAKAAELSQLGNAVDAAYAQLKLARDSRVEAYRTLSARIQRIKDAVASQYGNKSSEYALLKSLKV